MAKICTISDESDTSGEEHVEAQQGAKASRSPHRPSVPHTSRGESVSRLGPVGNVQKHSPVSCALYPRCTTHKAK